MTDWHNRDEMKLGVGVVAFMIIMLTAVLVFAGGLQASFENSRFSGMTRHSTVAEYWGVVDGSNNLIDMSGENLLTDRTEFDDWIQFGTCTVTADQLKNPVDGVVDADLLDNTGGANTNCRYIDTAALGALAGRTFTSSMWIRADYIHTVTLQINEVGVGVMVTDTVVVTTKWKRYWITGTASGGGGGTLRAYAYPGENGVSTGKAYFYGAQLVENDEWRTGMGVFLNPSDQSITKPDHDLAHTNNPTTAKVHFQHGGNKLEARGFVAASNQRYTKADHASFNVFDQDHTITMLVKANADGADYAAFAHGSWNFDGIYVYVATASDNFTVRYFNNGGSVAPFNAIDPSDLLYHVVQVVRDNNTATVYVDGVAGTGVDVTGYGIDAVRNLAIGATSGGGSDLTGDVSYTRLDAEALSTDDLASDREKLLGIATNWSDVNAWDFERSTTAYKTFSNQYESMYPSHSMDLIAVDTPRVAGQGGGLLIEGEVTQLHGFTEVFGSWIQSGTCAVTADNYVAPNGTTTADLLDNTGGANIDRRVITTVNLGDLTGRTFTASLWLRTDTPHIASYYVWESGVGHVTGVQDVFVTAEWNRFAASGSCTGGGTGTLAFSITPGEYGVAQDIVHVWGANLTETPFVTSYIPNSGAATSQVTRAADVMTLDPHPAGTNEYILPEEFCDTCIASKLTIYGEFRCAWSSSADIGVTTRKLVDISGNTGASTATRNRVFFQFQNNGRMYAFFRDDADTDHYAYTAVNPIDFSDWFSLRFVVDMANLSRMEFYLNEDSFGSTYVNNNGTATWDTTDNLIRIGQQYNGTVDGFCHVRNLRIVSAEVRP